MLRRNINAIVSKLVDNKEIASAMQYLNNEEQIGFATVLIGCQLTAEELPQIPDNDIAKNVTVTYINPVKNSIEIQYEALKEQKYKDGKWQWFDAETPVTKYDTISYGTYMKYSRTGYKAD